MGAAKASGNGKEAKAAKGADELSAAELKAATKKKGKEVAEKPAKGKPARPPKKGSSKDSGLGFVQLIIAAVVATLAWLAYDTFLAAPATPQAPGDGKASSGRRPPSLCWVKNNA